MDIKKHKKGTPPKSANQSKDAVRKEDLESQMNDAYAEKIRMDLDEEFGEMGIEPGLRFNLDPIGDALLDDDDDDF